MLFLTNKAILVMLDPVPTKNNVQVVCQLKQLQSHSASQSATTPHSMLKMTKQEHCYGSVDYWKCMYKQSQAIIHQSYEQSLKLEEISGLLTVEKVTLKVNKNKNTRITNVHRSMEGQDILKLVESIEKDKISESSAENPRKRAVL